MATPTHLQPTYVLHHKPWRDTSLIVDVWCMHTGRQTLIARGARKMQGKQPAKRALLQPFHPLQLSYAGRGDMGYIQHIEMAGAPLMLQGKSLYCGMYINELLLKLLPIADPYPALFAYYQEALNHLASPVDAEPVLRRFENHLLEELGYQVNLQHDIDSHQAITTNDYYEFLPLRGVRKVNVETATIGQQHGQAKLLIQGHDLLALATQQQHNQTLKQLSKTMARANLDELLAGKTLRSRELFRQMTSPANTPIQKQ